MAAISHGRRTITTLQNVLIFRLAFMMVKVLQNKHSIIKIVD